MHTLNTGPPRQGRTTTHLHVLRSRAGDEVADEDGRTSRWSGHNGRRRRRRRCSSSNSGDLGGAFDHSACPLILLRRRSSRRGGRLVDQSHSRQQRAALGCGRRRCTQSGRQRGCRSRAERSRLSLALGSGRSRRDARQIRCIASKWSRGWVESRRGEERSGSRGVRGESRIVDARTFFKEVVTPARGDVCAVGDLCEAV